jgi:hypothetical protein
MRSISFAIVLVGLLALAMAQSEDAKLCSLSVLINDKCTKDDDISCRRCYFKECHKIGGPAPAQPLPGDSKPFGKVSAPQDCEELKTCLENANCKDE